MRKWSPFRKIAGIIVLLLIIGFAFLFLVEPRLEQDESEKIAAFISSLPGDLKAEKITSNLLEKNFIIHNLTGTIKGPGGSNMEVRALEITLSGFDAEAAKAQGVVPLFKEGEITHMSVRTVAPDKGGTQAASREMRVERLFFHDVRGSLASLPAGKAKGGDEAEALMGFLRGLSFGDLSVYGYADKAVTAQGPVSVSAQNASFKAGTDAAGRGSLGDVGKLLLPGLLEGKAGSAQDRQAISDGLAKLTQGSGSLAITLQPAQPVPMAQLASDGAVPLNAKVELGPGR